tara:strand:+ start:111 stop:1052 length:942 start_codon:yes stop_codon:yes gene_type:complete
MRGLSDKSLLCIRHGVTDMNVYLSGCSYGSPGFVDPGLFDTRLTPDGEALAASALRKNLAAAHERAPIELVVSSPLTRALKTAELGLGSLTGIPRTVSPLIAERRYLSSDVGRSPSVLASEFPAFFSDAATNSLAERWWWAGSEADADAAREQRLALQRRKLPPLQRSNWKLQGEALPVEPEEQFVRRIQKFMTWLEERPERRIAIVAHWGVHTACSKRHLRGASRPPRVPQAASEGSWLLSARLRGQCITPSSLVAPCLLLFRCITASLVVGASATASSSSAAGASSASRSRRRHDMIDFTGVAPYRSRTLK